MILKGSGGLSTMPTLFVDKLLATALVVEEVDPSEVGQKQDLLL